MFQQGYVKEKAIQETNAWFLATKSIDWFVNSTLNLDKMRVTYRGIKLIDH